MNSLVQPYIEGVRQEITMPLYDPRFPKRQRAHYQYELVPELEWANSLFVATGVYPARAWILLDRASLDAIDDLYATDFVLNLGGQDFGGLSFVQSRCVTSGIDGDPAGVYLAEMTDARGVVHAPWMDWPLTAQFNVVSPAYPGQYHALSTNAGAPWTWAGMLEAIWNMLPSIFGPWPGLPAIPSGTPENYIFVGQPLWPSFCRILERLGMTVSVDLTQANPYSIVVRSGDVQKQGPTIEDDFSWIDAGSGRVAGAVTIYFHRRNEFYGTEETVRNDSLQWSSTPYYAVTYTAADLGLNAFTNAVAQAFLWDDFTVRFDVNGDPLGGDVTVAEAIALERAEQYYDQVYWETGGFMRQLYAGIVPYATSGQIDGVRWFQDFKAGRLGWRTEIRRGVRPPWPQLEVKRALSQ